MKKLSAISCTLLAAFAIHAYADTVPQNVHPETSVTKSVQDSEIVSTLQGINRDEIKLAELGAKKSMNQSVQQYAQQVMVDHRNAEKQLDQIKRKNRLGESITAEKRDMREETIVAMRRINKMEGAHFDQAYIDQEIAQNQQTLQLIDHQLMKKVNNMDLRDYMNNLRSVINANLQTAKQIRATI